MTRVGITGHQGLPEAAIEYIKVHVRSILAGLEAPLLGYSSLAEGADQLVAEEILKVGGQLHVVIPSRHYETTLQGSAAQIYRRLLTAAVATTELPYPQPDEQAYDSAGKWIADHCDVMIAIWDGQPAKGLGGTADAVAHARALSKDVHVVWPNNISR